jgi:TPR repeat protein
MIAPLGHWSGRGKRRRIASSAARTNGEADMARFEVMGGDSAVLGEANASGDVLFRLGMMYSTGSSVPTDYVSAHKWFNLAAMRGNSDAVRLRREIAELMSESEIAAAQRAARDWLRH